MMSPRRFITSARRLLTISAVLLLVLAIVAGLVIGGGLLFATSRRSEDLAQLTHAFSQQNVNARYDDCINGDAVRRALYQQTKASARSDALLYKSLPSLDTPQVHQLVAQTRAKQLAAFAPRGRRGCAAYALRAVPPGARDAYRVQR